MIDGLKPCPFCGGEEMFGKMHHSTKEEADAYEAMLESMSVELHPVDRDALLNLADTLDSTSETDCKGCRLEGAGCAECSSGIAHEAARRIREALGVDK